MLRMFKAKRLDPSRFTVLRYITPPKKNDIVSGKSRELKIVDKANKIYHFFEVLAEICFFFNHLCYHV